MANRQLQGAIFKHEGTSYLVLEDNQWDSEQLKVRSIDRARHTETMSRSLIQRQVSGMSQSSDKTG